MKKIVIPILLLLNLLFLTGCNNYPTITGVVEEVRNGTVLITNNDGKYDVALNTDDKNFNIGDEVVVHYDGYILETYPMQIRKVYDIKLIENK